MKYSFPAHIALVATVAIILGTPFGAFGQTEADATGKKEKKPVNAATVNGQPISYAAFEQELGVYSKRFESRGIAIPENMQGQVRQEVLNELISRELIYQESRKKNTTIEEGSTQKELAAIKKQFPDQAQFEEQLTKMNMTEEKLAQQISRFQYIRTFMDQEISSKIKISDDEAKKFFDENPQYFKSPEEVHARHILIKLDKEADDKAKDEARKTLLDLKKRAEGGEDFSELAKAHSQGPSAPKGGDLGFFSKGKMVPPFENAAFKMKPGEVSDVVESQFGYHLIKVEEHRDAETKGFDSVKTTIVDNLRRRKAQEEAKKYVENLRKDAKIETFIEEGRPANTEQIKESPPVEK
ncbi:MAG: hypothetical protein HKP58_01135 [Desulfatitalea sp.]|nr:peptidylprolyl isomerase [Desulfatitalea sp.]NNJ98990.1 hypothetical protein [Desulfatitalea sp.]